MTHPLRSSALLIGCVLLAASLRASFQLPISTGQQLAASAAVVRGGVVGLTPYLDPAAGEIYTRAVIRVDETFKGRTPALLRVVHPGGTLGGIAHSDSSSPQLRLGEEVVLFLVRRPDGTLTPLSGPQSAIRLQGTARPVTSLQAGATTRVGGDTLLKTLRGNPHLRAAGESVVDQAELAVASPLSGGAETQSGAPIQSLGGGSFSNLTLDQFFSLYPTRFLQPDRGEPIPYVIDATHRPAGITSNQIFDAVQSALRAWTNVAPVRFAFAGWSNFGNTALTFTNANGSFRRDGLLRIQTHDFYGAIADGPVISKGGNDGSAYLAGEAWGSGGSIKGCEVFGAWAGFLAIEHTNVLFQNTNVLAEVLCHEIGHALGLAHTSENPSEPTNSPLFQSIMYYRAHGDNRGAALGAIDGPDLCQLHPTTNFVPFSDLRLIDVVIATNAPTNAGVNQVTLKGYDLDGTPLIVATNDAYTDNGYFSLNGLDLKFIATNLAPQARITDPSDPYTYHDQIFVRFSDGTNASAYTAVNTVALSADTYPGAQSDGLSDNWMFLNLGTIDPASGPRLGPNDDYDGDGHTNFEEFLMGSNPADPMSNIRILYVGSNYVTFQARPAESTSRLMDVYELETTTNLTNWMRVGHSLQPRSAVGVFTNLTLPDSTARIFRVRRLP